MLRRPSGLFLRREAVASGVSDEELRLLVRSKALVRVRQGAYLPYADWQSLDDQGRHLARAEAVILSHEERVALSHVSGAIAHGLRVWGSDLTRVHVVRLDDQTGRSTHDVRHHIGEWAFGGVHEVAGLPVLDRATCAVGAAAGASLEAGIVVVDSAYDLGVDRDELRVVVDRVRRWPGTARLQLTMRIACPGSQSVGESRLRYICFSGHLPAPVLQHPVRNSRGTLVGIADLAWPERRVLAEFDGRVKYGRYLRDGESPGDAVFREKIREDAIREATGWRVLRFTWSDLADRRQTLERLRVAIGVRGSSR